LKMLKAFPVNLFRVSPGRKALSEAFLFGLVEAVFILARPPGEVKLKGGHFEKTRKINRKS